MFNNSHNSILYVEHFTDCCKTKERLGQKAYRAGIQDEKCNVKKY